MVLKISIDSFPMKVRLSDLYQ